MKLRSLVSTAAMVLFSVSGVALVLGADPVPNPLEKAKAGQWIFDEIRGDFPFELLKSGMKPDTSKVGGTADPSKTDKTAKPDEKKDALNTMKTAYCYKFVERVEGKQIHLMSQKMNADGKTALEAPVPHVINLDDLGLQAKPEAKPGQTGQQQAQEQKGAEGAVDGQQGEEEIVVKGKKLKCTKIEHSETDPTKGHVTLIKWISKDVPIFGLARAVVLDKDKKELARIDLLDFGETGGAAKPVGAEKQTSENK